MNDHNAHVMAWKQHCARQELARRGLWLPTSKKPWVRGADVAETFRQAQQRAGRKFRVA